MKNPFAPLIDMYCHPTAKARAEEDRYDAQHSLLEAHKDMEWAQARIHAYEVRIERLDRFITGEKTCHTPCTQPTATSNTWTPGSCATAHCAASTVLRAVDI